MTQGIAAGAFWAGGSLTTALRMASSATPGRCRRRRVARPADRVDRQAGAGLAGMAHDLKPTVAAIEALRDRREG
jgi:hypothetical protein